MLRVSMQSIAPQKGLFLVEAFENVLCPMKVFLKGSCLVTHLNCTEFGVSLLTMNNSSIDGKVDILTSDERRLMFDRAKWLPSALWIIVSLSGLLLLLSLAKVNPNLRSFLWPAIQLGVFAMIGYTWLKMAQMNRCPRCGKFYLGHFVNPRLAKFQHPPTAHYPAQCSRCGVYFFEDLTEKSAAEFHALMIRQQLGHDGGEKGNLND